MPLRVKEDKIEEDFDSLFSQGLQNCFEQQQECEGPTDLKTDRESIAMINARITMTLPELVKEASVDSSVRRLDELRIPGQ